MIASTDLALHIEWLLDQVEPAKSQLMRLMDEDVQADIFCFWESRADSNGIAGGMIFSPTLLGRLAALKLQLGLDIYFAV